MAETSELVVKFRSLNERAKSTGLAPDEQLAWTTLKSELIEALTRYADSPERQQHERPALRLVRRSS
ncbi:MAG: hypothetical protein ACK4N5_16075 [Myxococcales bacterium]